MKNINEKFYYKLLLIRRVEEEIARIYPLDDIKSPIHLSIGQEAVSVGVCEALTPKDVIFGTYRGHAVYLAKGGDLNQMIAELYGKETGCAKGKGGSMHLIDIVNGVMGMSAIVGMNISVSVGYAYGLKLKKSNEVVASFFGEGAADEGTFHESLNFAALKKLPVLFICENNQYAIHSHQSNRQANPDVCAKARAHGIGTCLIESHDPHDIYLTTKACVEKIQKGQGPCFIECMTSRWKEHVGPNDDFDLGYRSEKEVQTWKDQDCLVTIGSKIEKKKKKAIEDQVQQEIIAAFTFAQKSKFPHPNTLYDDMFKE